MSLALYQLGQCLIDQEMYEDAVRYLKEAVELNRTLNNKESTAKGE